MKYFEIIGFIGAALMVATLAMKAMIPLRVVGIASNIFQIAFALSVGITPMLIQHGILLPVNAFRLYEHIRLVRKVRSASNKDYSMSCLIPFMTKRQFGAGQILFHKDDPAGEMFIVASGRLRLREIAVDVLPGGVVGELGLLTPNRQRTQTLECVEDAEGHADRLRSRQIALFRESGFRFPFAASYQCTPVSEYRKVGSDTRTTQPGDSTPAGGNNAPVSCAGRTGNHADEAGHDGTRSPSC
jgi:CRP/FNR family cyclic AMP-dependent transcriptional regulator